MPLRIGLCMRVKCFIKPIFVKNPFARQEVIRYEMIIFRRKLCRRIFNVHMQNDRLNYLNIFLGTSKFEKGEKNVKYRKNFTIFVMANDELPNHCYNDKARIFYIYIRTHCSVITQPLANCQNSTLATFIYLCIFSPGVLRHAVLTSQCAIVTPKLGAYNTRSLNSNQRLTKSMSILYICIEVDNCDYTLYIYKAKRCRTFCIAFAP